MTKALLRAAALGGSTGLVTMNELMRFPYPPAETIPSTYIEGRVTLTASLVTRIARPAWPAESVRLGPKDWMSAPSNASPNPRTPVEPCDRVRDAGTFVS